MLAVMRWSCWAIHVLYCFMASSVIPSVKVLRAKGDCVISMLAINRVVDASSRCGFARCRNDSMARIPLNSLGACLIFLRVLAKCCIRC